MMIRIPARLHFATASATSGRGGSIIPARPKNVRSRSTSSAVPPGAVSGRAPARASTRSPAWAISSFSKVIRRRSSSVSGSSLSPSRVRVQRWSTSTGAPLTNTAQRSPSRRKRMATIHREGDRWAVFVKGAPVEVLQRCTRTRDGERELPLTEEERRRITLENDEMAHAGLRVLALAGARPETAPGGTAEEVERDLTFFGLVGMMDPPRPEVAEAVAKCHRAGIRIIMVTGDYGLTAESVARRVGILQGGSPRILNGSEMDGMAEPALEEALRGEVILARVAPEHKLRAVSALQRMGHVVAVTGDGVNDAPALKKADIGVAMGIAGTDVAKEAADMVLADDNFASIVSAVEAGRAVYANIKKFIAYIFTSNTPE